MMLGILGGTLVAKGDGKRRTRPIASRKKQVAALHILGEAVTMGSKGGAKVRGKKDVPIVTIGSKRYCAVGALSSAARAGGSSTHSTWSVGDALVVAVPASFFIRIETRDSVKVVQMALPAVRRSGTVYVPYPQFFESVASAGICSFSSESSTLSLGARPLLAQRTSGVRVPTLAPIRSAVSGERPLKERRPQSSIEISSPSSVPVSADSGAVRTDDVDSGRDTLRIQVPVRQAFPANMKRRELDDSLDASLMLNDALSEPSRFGYPGDVSVTRPVFASLSGLAHKGVPRITRVRVRAQASGVVFTFTSDEALHQPPRAFVKGRRLRIEFPGAVNAARYPSSFAAARISRFRSFLGTSAQIYTANLPSDDMNVRVQSRGVRSVEVTCAFSGMASTVGRKDTDGTPGEGRQKAPAAEKEISRGTAKGEAKGNVDVQRRKWTFDCVVIDAGHGGKDDGAHSVNGYKEKDATLAIALRLRDEIRRVMPGLRVVMTRSTDVFIPLHERGSIANRADGKLFISIHCNSVPQKPSKARGCETYILSPAKTAAAIDVAARENAVVQLEDERDRYSGLTEEQKVLATLAQTSFVNFSSEFAHTVQRHVPPLTGMTDRGVSQAGFLVLVCASMPAVLVETGFVSHPQDEQLLFGREGQRKIARGIAAAVRDYASAYAKVLRR